MTIGRFFSGWLGGLISAFVVVAIAVVGWLFLSPRETETGNPPAPVASQPETTPAEPVAQPEAQAPTAETETTAPEAAPEPTTNPGTTPPTAESDTTAPEAAPEPQAEPGTTPPTAESETTAPEAAPESAAEPGATTPAAETETTAPEAAPETPDAAVPLAPSFDVVRIKPDGSALVAGRAEPGAEIAVIVDGATVAASKSDAGAGFVAMFDLPPSEKDRVMTLEAILSDGTRLASEVSVIVEGVEMPVVVAEADTAPEPAPEPTTEQAPVPEPEQTPAPEQTPVPEPEPTAEPAPAGEPAHIQPVQPDTNDVPQAQAPAEDTSTEPAQEMSPTQPAPDTAPQAPAAPDAPDAPAQTEPATAATEETEPELAEPAPAPEPAPEPQAPRILLAGPEGLRVLQDASPEPQLSVDAIAYDADGEVALSGRGTGTETLRIYVDNEAIAIAEVDPNGEWRAPLPDIDAGVYTLRVDSIASDGAVTHRVETPFKREDQAMLAAAGREAAKSGKPVSAITVQPGNTLWAIAEGRYGEGLKYWAIFDANRDQIRDPHWIYPGQVFTLPETAE